MSALGTFLVRLQPLMALGTLDVRVVAVSTPNHARNVFLASLTLLEKLVAVNASKRVSASSLLVRFLTGLHGARLAKPLGSRWPRSLPIFLLSWSLIFLCCSGVKPSGPQATTHIIFFDQFCGQHCLRSNQKWLICQPIECAFVQNMQQCATLASFRSTLCCLWHVPCCSCRGKQQLKQHPQCPHFPSMPMDEMAASRLN